MRGKGTEGLPDVIAHYNYTPPAFVVVGSAEGIKALP